MNDQSSYRTPDPNQPPIRLEQFTPPPKRKRHRGRVLLVIVSAPFAVLLGVGVVLAIFSVPLAHNAADNAPVISPAPSSEPGPAVPARKPVEQAPQLVPHDGTLFVGKDVRPGVYVATVPMDSAGCYTARLKDVDDSLDSVISNHIGAPGAQVVLTVRKTDYAIEVRCDGAKWTRR